MPNRNIIRSCPRQHLGPSPTSLEKKLYCSPGGSSGNGCVHPRNCSEHAVVAWTCICALQVIITIITTMVIIIIIIIIIIITMTKKKKKICFVCLTVAEGRWP